MDDSYRFVYSGGTGEITEKKSRFIASVAPACSEDEACRFIEKTRKRYWDAKHNCTAFTIGKGHALTRSSDDGEPAGTAGHPMLNVLLCEDVHDTVVVVTRYFGGVLLGTGGLVRAYTDAVREGLKSCTILEKRPGTRITVRAGYGDYGKLQYLAVEMGVPLLSSSFTDTVTLEFLVPSGSCSGFIAAVTEATGARACCVKGAEVLFALDGSEIRLF